MKIKTVQAQPDWLLLIHANDGKSGIFDVKPYLKDEAFQELHDACAFAKVFNGGYFIEWECGADLSADTIEANWENISEPTTIIL